MWQASSEGSLPSQAPTASGKAGVRTWFGLHKWCSQNIRFHLVKHLWAPFLSSTLSVKVRGSQQVHPRIIWGPAFKAGTPVSPILQVRGCPLPSIANPGRAQLLGSSMKVFSCPLTWPGKWSIPVAVVSCTDPPGKPPSPFPHPSV